MSATVDEQVLELLHEIRELLDQHSAQFKSIQLSLQAAQKPQARLSENLRITHELQALTRRVDVIERRLGIKD